MPPLQGFGSLSYSSPRVARCALTLGYCIERFQRSKACALPYSRATLPTTANRTNPDPQASTNPSQSAGRQGDRWTL